MNYKMILLYFGIIGVITSSCLATTTGELYKEISALYLSKIAPQTMGEFINKNAASPDVRKKIQKTVFSILENESKDGLPSNELEVPTQTWEDLDLFSTRGTNKEFSILSKINRTQTYFGEAALARMLASPFQKRAEVIQNFINHKNLHETLEKLIEIECNNEVGLIELLHTQEWEDNKYRSAYFRWVFNKHFISLTPLVVQKILHFLNRFIFYVEHKANTSTLLLTLTRLGDLRNYLALQTIGTGYVDVAFNKVLYRSSSYLTQVIKGNIPFWPQKWLIGGLAVPHIIVLAIVLHLIVKLELEKRKKISNIVNFSISLRNYIKALKNSISELQNFNSLFKSIIPSFDDKVKKVDELYEILKNEPYILKTYNNLRLYYILQANKDKLIAAAELGGEIDAFVSLATLYNGYKNKRACYNAVQFQTNEKPFLEAHEVWYPGLDVEKAVPNSLSLGKKDAPNIIITGPNAGGKSTVLKALALTIIFAHCFGIVPAKECSLTPFKVLNTYLNIADNPSAGRSLFQTEIDRSEEIYKRLKALPANKFSFTIMDELFTGTDPEQGKFASFALAEAFGHFKNNLLAFATHFKFNTTLAKKYPDLFSNYKVLVSTDQKGNISFPYKLVPGISDQNIVEYLLKESNFPLDLVNRIKELKNQKKEKTN